MEDLVSIIMPSHNTGNYILKTIQSIIDQTYSNWELIIIDDASTDNTIEIIKSISDQRIVLKRNDKNYGAAISRNKALMTAKGRWIAFLDSDDLWYPQKLEKQLLFMKNHGYAFSYTEYEEIDEKGNKLGIIVTGPKKITKTLMYNYCWPGCLTVMYDRNVIGDINISDIKKNNDYAMWLQICELSNCYLLGEILASYRRRTGSISNQNYSKLIKWHYKLFRDEKKQNIFLASVNTFRNMIFGVYKKIIYVKKL